MRKLIFAALLGLSYCAPAHAGGHGGYSNHDEDGDFAITLNELIKGQKQVNDGTYIVTAVGMGAPLMVLAVPRDTHYADVIFKNQLAPAWQTHEGVDFHMADGKVITVIFNMGNGETPDTMTVLPPPGYIALPPEVTVEEGAEATVEIHEATLG